MSLFLDLEFRLVIVYSKVRSVIIFFVFVTIILISRLKFLLLWSSNILHLSNLHKYKNLFQSISLIQLKQCSQNTKTPHKTPKTDPNKSQPSVTSSFLLYTSPYYTLYHLSSPLHSLSTPPSLPTYIISLHDPLLQINKLDNLQYKF